MVPSPRRTESLRQFFRARFGRSSSQETTRQGRTPGAAPARQQPHPGCGHASVQVEVSATCEPSGATGLGEYTHLGEASRSPPLPPARAAEATPQQRGKGHHAVTLRI